MSSVAEPTQALSANKKIMGGKRNSSNIDLDAPAIEGPRGSSSPSGPALTFDEKSRRDRHLKACREGKNRTQPILPSLKDAKGEYACIIDDCEKTFNTMRQACSHMAKDHLHGAFSESQPALRSVLRE